MEKKMVKDSKNGTMGKNMMVNGLRIICMEMGIF
jgi:hypothetical protein